MCLADVPAITRVHVRRAPPPFLPAVLGRAMPGLATVRGQAACSIWRAMAREDATLPLRLCATPGCLRRFLAQAADRHLYCCSECERRGGNGDNGNGHRHTRRCRRQQGLLGGYDGLSSFSSRSSQFPAAYTIARNRVCATRGCHRGTNVGHRTCCSTCRNSGSLVHTYRCHRRYSAAGAPATMPDAGTVTSTSSTTARLPTRTESAEAAVMSSQAGSRPCWDTSSASAGSSQMPISRTDARLSSSTRPVHTAHEPQYTSQRDAYDCAPLTGLDEMD